MGRQSQRVKGLDSQDRRSKCLRARLLWGASSLPLPVSDGARCSSVGSDLFPTRLPSAGGFSREQQVSHLFVSRGP